MTRLANPFVVGRYIDDSYFCDREEETSFLKKQIVNGRDVSIISPRRMGKSGLIHHLMQQPEVKNHYHTIFIDIYATTTLHEFADLLSKAVFSELINRNQSLFKKAIDIIRSFRPLAKIDAVTGEPSLEFNVSSIPNPELTLSEIFTYLENADKPCLLAIDEFQQISHYKDLNVEARLRTLMQQCKRSRFIFSGSEQSMMTEMFTSSHKPFYQSCLTMGLKPIPEDIYVKFASRKFSEYEKVSDSSLFSEVYRRFDGITWYVQMMMNEIFSLTDQGSAPPANALELAENNIIDIQDVNYKEIMARLSPRQRELLRAMVRFSYLNSDLTSGEFLRLSGFSTAAMVQAALNGLIKAGVVTSSQGKYIIYDRFFARWVAINNKI